MRHSILLIQFFAIYAVAAPILMGSTRIPLPLPCCDDKQVDSIKPAVLDPVPPERDVGEKKIRQLIPLSVLFPKCTADSEDCPARPKNPNDIVLPTHHKFRFKDVALATDTSTLNNRADSLAIRDAKPTATFLEIPRETVSVREAHYPSRPQGCAHCAIHRQKGLFLAPWNFDPINGKHHKVPMV
jgi:hypothetical protein